MSDSFPVHVAVRRSDGNTEQVRVGTAYREGEGFRLELGELSIGGTADHSAPARASSGGYASSGGGSYGGSAGGGGGSGLRFPNYGRSKGGPIEGASEGDLEYYANGARRSLADPSKARFHDKERALLAAIEAELNRQRGGGGGGGGGEEGGGGYGGGGGGGGGG
ncbi:MAG: hypothetical protein M3Y59_24815, partial [Myxococcota bacterium]|nr:hypothetical protein [Myxococcota bacterium]